MQSIEQYLKSTLKPQYRELFTLFGFRAAGCENRCQGFSRVQRFEPPHERSVRDEALQGTKGSSGQILTKFGLDIRSRVQLCVFQDIRS
jgi:hypothetical protein